MGVIQSLNPSSGISRSSGLGERTIMRDWSAWSAAWTNLGATPAATAMNSLRRLSVKSEGDIFAYELPIFDSDIEFEWHTVLGDSDMIGARCNIHDSWRSRSLFLAVQLNGGARRRRSDTQCRSGFRELEKYVGVL